MLRSTVAAVATALALAAVGCAAEAPAEGAGTTSSAVSNGADAALLARLGAKIDGCGRLTDAELSSLKRLAPGPFSFSADVYVYISCTLAETGEVLSASVDMEQRAGFSSDDGAFTETALTASTTLEIPIKVVTASGSVAYEQTVRASSSGVTYDSATTVGVGVEKSFVLAKASVQADFGSDSASITGGVESPIEIPLAACDGGSGSFGARIALTATKTESDIDPAIRAKAQDLLVQNADNVWVFDRVGDRSEEQSICCGAQGTCATKR